MWSLLLALQAAPPVAPSRAPARWVLVYAGADRVGIGPYPISHFTRLLAHVDSAGQPAYWQCTGAIFLHLYAPSGRVFTTWIGGVPANGADWTEYLDSLFVRGGALSRLDSAEALASATLGPPSDPVRVSIMIPYPEPKAGTLRFGGKHYDLRTADGRVGAATAYVAAVALRFGGAGHARLRLDGFYWLLETMPTSDAGVVRRVAREVHARGFRFLWIPYYDAEGWERWHELGFDEAWLQPNYFFNRDVAPSRVDSAAARAVQRGMGLEIEFDRRLLLATPGFGDRLGPYLEALRRYPQLLARSIAIYEGGGALRALSHSLLPADRLRYEQLGQALRWSGP
jgi:uncharacterized protein DUF4855